MFVHTWSNTPDGGESHEFSVDFPSDHSDTDLIEKRFGSETRLFECAARQFAVDCAAGNKKALARGDIAGAEHHAENFCADGTRATRGVTMSVASMKELGFTDEQIAHVQSEGVKLDD